MARRRGDETVHQLCRRLHDGSLPPRQEGAAHRSPQPHTEETAPYIYNNVKFEMEENAANLSTAERKKLDCIRKQIDECREYHDRLHVVADEQIQVR